MWKTCHSNHRTEKRLRKKEAICHTQLGTHSRIVFDFVCSFFHQIHCRSRTHHGPKIQHQLSKKRTLHGPKLHNKRRWTACVFFCMLLGLCCRNLALPFAFFSLQVKMGHNTTFRAINYKKPKFEKYKKFICH